MKQKPYLGYIKARHCSSNDVSEANENAAEKEGNQQVHKKHRSHRREADHEIPNLHYMHARCEL